MTPDEMSALAEKDAAPKKAAAAKKAPAKKATTRKRTAKKPAVNIKARSTESIQQLGGLLIVAGAARESEHLAYDGRVLAARAEAIGEALDELAAEDPRVKRALERVFTASSWSKLVLVSAQVAVPVMACHGYVPKVAAAPFAGDVGLPPDPPKRAPRPAKPRPTEPAPAADAGALFDDLRAEESNGAAAASGLPDAPGPL